MEFLIFAKSKIINCNRCSCLTGISILVKCVSVCVAWSMHVDINQTKLNINLRLNIWPVVADRQRKGAYENGDVNVRVRQRIAATKWARECDMWICACAQCRFRNVVTKMHDCFLRPFGYPQTRLSLCAEAEAEPCCDCFNILDLLWQNGRCVLSRKRNSLLITYNVCELCVYRSFDFPF